jgi:hypothetical protein
MRQIRAINIAPCSCWTRITSVFCNANRSLNLVGFEPALLCILRVEQVTGWNAYLNRAKAIEGVVRGYQMFERILADFASARVASFDEDAARVFEQFRAQRIRVGTMDLRIAAIAVVQDMTLLSRNLSDFRRVPSLRTEDWTN